MHKQAVSNIAPASNDTFSFMDINVKDHAFPYWGRWKQWHGHHVLNTIYKPLHFGSWLLGYSSPRATTLNVLSFYLYCSQTNAVAEIGWQMRLMTIRSKQVTTRLFEAKGAKFRQMHVTPTIPMLDQGVGFPVIILVGNCCTRVRIKDVFCKHQVCITPTRTPE